MDIGQLSPLGFIIVVFGLVSAIITIIAFVFDFDTIKRKLAVLTVIFVCCFIVVRIFSSSNPPTPSKSGTQTAINARVTPTATPTPTPIPSPTPTLITITKNLDISGSICCGLKLNLKLTTIVIDTTEQKSTWNFILTNNGNTIDNVSFKTLVLEDNTGQEHQGGGLASTDHWNMSSGESIPTYATFDVVHGTNYFLNLAIDYGTYQTVIITF